MSGDKEEPSYQPIRTLKGRNAKRFPEKRFRYAKLLHRLFFIGILIIGGCSSAAYFYRDDLLLNASVYRELSAFCAKFHCTPPRASGYRYIQLGPNEFSKQPGNIQIRSRISHKAKRNLRWPKLKLTLSDKYGQLIQQSSFTASQYLGDQQGDADFPPNKAFQIQLQLSDPNLQAWGYELKLDQH